MVSTASKRLAELLVYTVGAAYWLVFAWGGYLVWRPVWAAHLEPLTAPSSEPVAQMIGGAAHALVLVGPFAGMAVGAVIFKLAVVRYRRSA